MERHVTTIRMEYSLIKDARKRAIDEGITFAELVERAVRAELTKKPAAPRKPASRA